MADYPSEELVMVKGMPEFESQGMYADMMKRFADTFGDLIDKRPHATPTVVDLDTTQQWDGIDFKFIKGPSTDFPAASIIIDNQVFYTHWSPMRIHLSNHLLPSKAAVDVVLTQAEEEKKSSCTLFIGGHGGAANLDLLEFKIQYLHKVKELLSHNNDPQSFADALVNAYPNLPKQELVPDLAKALYQ